MKRLFLLVSLFGIYCSSHSVYAQSVQATKEAIAAYSQDWKGERSADGRPRVSDDLVRRARNISLDNIEKLALALGVEPYELLKP